MPLIECSIPDCSRGRYRQTWCFSHYRRWRLYGDPQHPNQKPGPKPESHPSREGTNKKRWTTTHCPNGHEINEENIYVRESGQPVCRVCNRGYQRKYHGKTPIPDSVPVGTWNRHKTHCSQGHEYTEANIYRKSDGSRACKVCHRARRIKSMYGLTVEEFDTLISKQGGGCAICKEQTEANLHVDHDHETGAVRGLLCGRCNTGVGQFKDRADLLRRAADYLDRFL